MSGEIEPALTAEEWAEMEFGPFNDGASINESGELETKTTEPSVWWDEERHALAALCLHGQPFGFTREDAVRHREEARWERECAEEDPTNPCAKGLAAADWHDSMADRIEALLPPEE